jgi:hypothetical protein
MELHAQSCSGDGATAGYGTDHGVLIGRGGRVADVALAVTGQGIAASVAVLLVVVAASTKLA